MTFGIMVLGVLISLFLTLGEAGFIVPPPAFAQMTSDIVFEGGPGDSLEKAVIIKGAANSVAGVAAEYRYLEQRFGKRNLDWRIQKQSVRFENGRHFDLLEIQLQDGSKKKIFFDISEFFGKL